MANVALDSKYGKVHRLKKNPRVITDSEFTGLVESLNDDGEFMEVRGIVAWLVPEDIKEKHPKSLFSCQGGKLVVLGGNQRYLALMAKGETRIDDDYIVLGKYKKDGVDRLSGKAHSAGDWWEVEKAERFVLKDNNPEGLSGEYDYDVMMKEFEEDQLRLSGIDFAQMPTEFFEKEESDIESEVEGEDHGEKNEKLEGFIEDREKSRSLVPDMVDVGFYGVPFIPVFESSDQWKKFSAFLQTKFGIVPRGQFVDGLEFAEKLGCKLEKTGLKFPSPKPEKRLQALSYDGSEEGWEKEAEDREEGTEQADDADEEKMGDGADMSFEDNGGGGL